MVGSKTLFAGSKTLNMPESLREVDAEPIREMVGSKP
jgi:hypothetical protein